MENIYLIGDLAKKTGLSIDTLNYYLRIGLIKETARSERSGYRLFDDEVLEELEQIVELRSDNVPIKDIMRQRQNGVL
ncbi:MAG: MerR family transcriptional regulator [Candidatus Marinimicrobia bacterium]|nr:MerR family transcriptional regulator [Candidatus Neomarinimicrobiota bacterium]MCF7830184.1 MerR family transcriptional regulator [Candidatus Neomarinimicrobiota bacterium]MCF7882082.1 MerR family transcriptional regulator [Candidatus Neomarinimicrobiota bacterium]